MMIKGSSSENQTWEVYYQLQFNLETYAIIGTEALVRRQNQGRILTPYTFLPDLECNGSIIDLDMWVFREVCKFVRERQKKRLPAIPMAINFSMTTVGNPFNVYEIIMMAREYNVPLEWLSIELTGAVPVSNEEILKSLEYLKRQGMRIAIDDLGISYASVALFSDIPFDQIKLGRYFFRSAMDDSRKRILLESMVKLAGDIEVDAVCVGIENELELEFVRKAGCKKGQGYLLARPVPKETFEDVVSMYPVWEFRKGNIR